MSLFTCRGLTRRPWIVERDLELQAGEVVFLRGPTGSGKSLFLRSLADLDPCDAGTVTLEGRERESFTPGEWRRNVLYLHQSAPRLPGTVSSNLERIRRLTGATAPADTFGLDAGADTERLSGGEGQLLALARAFLLEPRVLFLDEGTSAMDRETARRVEARLLERAQRGLTILWVSHDDELVERLQGRTVTFG